MALRYLYTSEIEPDSCTRAYEQRVKKTRREQFLTLGGLRGYLRNRWNRPCVSKIGLVRSGGTKYRLLTYG